MKLYVAVQSQNNLKLLWVLPKSEKFPKRRDFVIVDAPKASANEEGVTRCSLRLELSGRKNEPMVTY